MKLAQKDAPQDRVQRSLFLLDLDELDESLSQFRQTPDSIVELEPPLRSGKGKPYSYKPAAVRGSGPQREGYCEHCDKWFRLKTSSYWYHMNYKHGINAAGRVCPELEMRERGYSIEGFCRECGAWVFVGANKKSAKFGWYKHWQKSHSKGRTI